MSQEQRRTSSALAATEIGSSCRRMAMMQNVRKQGQVRFEKRGQMMAADELMAQTPVRPRRDDPVSTAWRSPSTTRVQQQEVYRSRPGQDAGLPAASTGSEPRNLSYLQRAAEAFANGRVPATQSDHSYNSDIYRNQVDENSVRLLLLSPGQGTEQIRCSLLPVSLSEDPPSYEAISYAWGDAQDRVTIRCNGYSMRITRSLNDALCRFRHPGRSRLVWADGICINQEDVEERGRQVRLMRTIYKRAARVLVWLGQPQSPSEAETAFATICSIANSCYISDDEYYGKTSAAFSPSDDSAPDAGYFPGGSIASMPGAFWFEPYWYVLVTLFRTQWFWRLWVVQEIASCSSATVYWGTASISWKWIGFAATQIRTHNSYALRKYDLKGLSNAYLMYRISLGEAECQPARLPFLKLLELTRHFGTTDPRDRLYALLGIPTSDTGPDLGVFFMEPDYNLSVEELYHRFASTVLEQEASLRLLSSVQHGAQICTDLPSWVPRWDLMFTRSLLPSDHPFDQTVLTGLPVRTAEYPRAVDSVILNLQGYEVGAVMEFFDLFSNNTNQICWDILRYSCVEGAHEEIARFLRTDHGRASLAWTLTAGRDCTGKMVVPGGEEGQAHYAGFCQWLLQCTRYRDLSWPCQQAARRATEVLPAMHLKSADIDRFEEAALDACAGRRLFFTGNGDLGLGPEAMLEGDVVCVLIGTPMPFVLRPEGEQWRLVGECYLDALRGSEALERLKAGRMPPKIFEVF